MCLLASGWPAMRDGAACYAARRWWPLTCSNVTTAVSAHSCECGYAWVKMRVIMWILSVDERRRLMCSIKVGAMICIRARMTAIVCLTLHALWCVTVCVTVEGCWGSDDASAKDLDHAAQTEWRQQVNACCTFGQVHINNPTLTLSRG